MAFEPGGMVEVTDKELLLPSEEIKRRMIEKAQILAELESRNPKPAPAPTSHEVQSHLDSGLSGRITADGATLARLVKRAARADARRHKAEEVANEARQSANEARARLEEYMGQTGLR